MPEAQKPKCLAMVLCDAAHRDPGNGKFTLLGTFHRLMSRSKPINSQFVAYFALTDCIGAVEIGLRIVDSRALLSDDYNEEHDLPDIQGKIASEDPLAIVEGVLGVRMVFPEPGVYYCELYSGDETLNSRRIIVAEPPGEHKNE